jgi:hypothetical protein
MDRSTTALTVSALALTLAAPLAHAHEGDIGLSFLAGRLTTGIVEIPSPGAGEFITPGQRVFAAEFADLAGSIYADEPGFFSGPLTGQTDPTIPAGSRLGFNILGSVLRWDSATQSFAAAAPAERIRIEFAAGALTRTSPLDGSSVPGFSFDVGPTGGFDEHLDYYLDPAPGQTVPAAGIYLLTLELYLDGISGSTSMPYYTVFNFGLDETEHDAAIDYVESNIIPTPTTALILASTAGLAFRRRRR